MCQPHRLWRFPRTLNETPPISRKDLLGSGGEEYGEDGKEREKEREEEFAHVKELVRAYHSHAVGEGQCCSLVAQRIRAPVGVVWSVVRRFDNPQAYKHFIRSCSMRGDGTVGSTREVRVVSGLPAESSTERLEILDDEKHVLSFRVVGGQHRLRNYRSLTTLHECSHEPPATIVLESYVVDIPEGNTREDTCLFADTIVKCNLTSLAHIAEHLASKPPRVF